MIFHLVMLLGPFVPSWMPLMTKGSFFFLLFLLFNSLYTKSLLITVIPLHELGFCDLKILSFGANF